MRIQDFPIELFKHLNPVYIEELSRPSLTPRLLNVKNCLRKAILEATALVYNSSVIDKYLTKIFVDHPVKKQLFFFTSIEGKQIQNQAEYEQDLKRHIILYLRCRHGMRSDSKCPITSSNRQKTIDQYILYLKPDNPELIKNIAEELPDLFIKYLNQYAIQVLQDSLKLDSITDWQEQCGFSFLEEITTEINQWTITDKQNKKTVEKLTDKIDTLYCTHFLQWNASLFFKHLDEKQIVLSLLKHDLIQSSFFDYKGLQWGDFRSPLELLIVERNYQVIEVLVSKGILNPVHFQIEHFNVLLHAKAWALLGVLFKHRCVANNWLENNPEIEFYSPFESIPDEIQRLLLPTQDFMDMTKLFSPTSLTKSFGGLSSNHTPTAPKHSPSPVGFGSFSNDTTAKRALDSVFSSMMFH